MKLMPVGVDIAKNVMQVHYVDMNTGEIFSKAIKRAKFIEFFTNRSPCLIGMEACGGAHHWARQLSRLGHQVKLMPGEFVKAFNIRNKNDTADAQAIWRAVQQPGKAVAVKTEDQQAMLALHRIRSQLLKFRLMQTNALHGLLAEYGEVMRTGRASLIKNVPDILARLSGRLPAVLIESLREQLGEVERTDGRIADIERRIRELSRDDPSVKAVSAIPGVGFLTATAAVASMGSADAFRSGREFAAWVGLVPRQTGTGGKIQLLGISKRGDKYLRKLLINGAHSVIQNAREPGAWVTDLLKRRPVNVASVALANKMARIIWAVLAHGRPYQKETALY
ncbi:ISCro5 transposase [Citrobacter freundii]|uniref:IS110 family transposase n=1 Tax=Gammaproteobacteria TaxID=1236 RepID=UPI0003B96811|nr:MULTISPECIES: IS110 family transposase [Gammaproteobacteria]EHF4985803.1 IS110 family transposase [Enterobacter hormaechei]EHX8394550.1 IS110 family transposase [Salmonella enterica subsp. enterica serovar Idikan]EKY1502700.1 IS110 family transposase [Enterobacter cloacae]VTM29492.1 transposase, IS110 family [Klebsiella pneumoniae]HDT2670257.1 IS110 family transposase [Klebsiella pneumoniae subsp. pneumoniae]